MTTIIVKPVGLGLDEKGRRDTNRKAWKDLVSHKREWEAREEKRVTAEAAKLVDQHLSKAKAIRSISPHRYPPPDPLFVASPGYNARWPEHRNAHQFKHIFDIALLLPSSRLILHLPFAANIELLAMLNAASVAFDPPPGMTHLTFLVECGNPKPIPPSGDDWWDDAESSWSHVEVVLVPNSVGAFTALDPFRDVPPNHTPAFGLRDRKDKLDWMMSSIAGRPCAHLPATSTYTVVGLENIDIMDEHQVEFEKLLLERIRSGKSAGARRVGVEFKHLEVWKEGASGEVCVQYV